jgi:hypothetical protein
MNPATSLRSGCDALYRALADRDQKRFGASMRKIAKAAQDVAPSDVEDVLRRLRPMLETIPYMIGGNLVQLAGSLLDYCDDTGEFLPVLVDRATEVMERATRFRSVYGEDPPSPEDPNLFRPAAARLRDTLAVSLTGPAQPGMPEPRVKPEAVAYELAEAWFAAAQWVQPVLFLSQRKDVRAVLPERDRLLAATEAAREHVGPAHWLNGVLLVLDDEPLIVLHRPTGHGYRLTVSGIGDNFQLHTLLAAHLIGDESRGMLPGTPPPPAAVAAASDGDELRPPGGIEGNFNLVDAYGNWIWNEGRPADIPHLDGLRVVVLDPPPYHRSWNAGRAYPLMRPDVTVAAVLPAAEAARWLAMVKPPRR